MSVISLHEVNYNPQHKDVLDHLLLQIPNVNPGKMFGYPAYYVGGKLFACVFEDAVGIKVPASVAHELLQREYIDFFQPLGRRKMREWIQINRSRSEDYVQDKDIFMLSVEYVSTLAGLGLKKKK